MVFKIISVGSIPAILVMSLLVKRVKKYTRPLKRNLDKLNKRFSRYNFDNLNGFRRKKYKNGINDFNKWFTPLKHNKGVFRQGSLSLEQTYSNSRLFYQNLQLLSSYIHYRTSTSLCYLTKVSKICSIKCLRNDNGSSATGIGTKVDAYLNYLVLNLINSNIISMYNVNTPKLSTSKTFPSLEISNDFFNFTIGDRVLHREEHFDSWLFIRLLKISTHYLNRKCLLGIYFSSSSYFNINNYYFLSLKNVHVFNNLLLPRSLTFSDYAEFSPTKLFNLSKFEFFTVPDKNNYLTREGKNTFLKTVRLNSFKVSFDILKKYRKYIKHSFYLKKSKRSFYSKLIRRNSYAFFKKKYIFKKLNLNKSKYFKKMKSRRTLKGSSKIKKGKRFLNLTNFKIRLYAKVDFVHKNFEYNKKIANVKGVNRVPIYSIHSSIFKKFKLFSSKFGNIYTNKNLVLTRNNFNLGLKKGILSPISKCFNLFSFAFFVKLSYLYSFDNILRFLHKGLVTNLVPSAQGFSYKVCKNLYSNRLNLSFRENTTPWMYNNIIRFIEFHSGRKVMLDIYSFMYQSIDFNYVVLYKFWLARFSYYERRLGHRFFLEEALHILHMSFSYQDSKLLSSWLKSMIKRISFWKTRFIFRFIRYLFNNYFRFLFKELGIKGLKIKLKGKISVAGNSRKRCILYRVGKTSHSTLDLKVVHTSDTIVTFTGVMGFQIWIFY